MSLKFKNEDEMRKWGLVLDPCDPAKSVPIGHLADRPQAATRTAGLPGDTPNGQPRTGDVSGPASEPDTRTEGSQPGAADFTSSVPSFASETSSGAVGEVSADSQANDAPVENAELQKPPFTTREDQRGGIRQMTTKNGHVNLFRKYTVAELEQFARGQHRLLVTENPDPKAYWLLQECLRQLELQKRLSPSEYIDFLTEILGFDREHLKRARTIHDNHKDMESLDGKTLREALDDGHKSSDGRTEPGHGKESVPASKPDTKAEVAVPTEAATTSRSESFARETLPGPVGDISGWSDDALLVGMRKECAEICTLEAPFSGRYHRLGTFVIETKKRFGDKNSKPIFRQEGIDSTKEWRSEQIAALYSYDQASAFPSLRAILKTLPPKQPRNPKEKKFKDSGGHPDTAPQKPTEVQPAASEENIVERFVELGIKVRKLLGDGAIDRAVEQIRTYIPETFEEAFVEA